MEMFDAQIGAVCSRIDQIYIVYRYILVYKKKVLLKLNSGYNENCTAFALLVIDLICFEKFRLLSIWTPKYLIVLEK